MLFSYVTILLKTKPRRKCFKNGEFIFPQGKTSHKTVQVVSKM